MNIHDYSEYQGPIDFGKVKGDAELVIFRVQAGSTHTDTYYSKYVEGAKANGIPFGTYAYGRFVSVTDAQQEAKDCYTRMDKATQFVVVDVESVSTSVASELANATQAYINELHALGVKKVGLYSGEGFYKAHGLSSVKADFLWIANYGIDDGKEHAKPSIPCDLWQYSSKSTESGVVGYIDVDALNGSKPLSYFTGGNTVTTQPIKTVPVTGNGHGELTIVVDTANVYYAHDYNSGIKEVVKKGDVYSYYEVYQGWYNVGAGWIPQQDVAVTSFTANPAPAPIVHESLPTKPVVVVAPAPIPSANTSAPASANVSGNAPAIPVPVVPTVPVSGNNVDAFAQLENAILKDPQLQKSFIQKVFSFFTSLFK